MKKKLCALMLGIALCSTYSAIAMEDVDFKTTGVATKYIQHHDKLEIITDNNVNASYQAESQRYAVTPGQIVKVMYSIHVTQGIMSLGALNTKRNGWYSTERADVEEIIRSVGSYNEVINWLVPANETETSLVLRNYHLKTPGESHFTVHKVRIEIKEPLTPEIQAHISKMIPSLLAIYERPKDQRKAYITEKCTEQDKEDICGCADNITKNNDYSGTAEKIRILKNKKKEKLSFIEQQSKEIQAAHESKTRTEQSLKFLHDHVQKQAYLLAPKISDDQLARVKDVILNYIKAVHNFKKLSGPIFTDVSAKKCNEIRASHINTIRTISAVDENYIQSRASGDLGKFELYYSHYLQAKEDEENAPAICKVAQQKINNATIEINNIDNEINTLSTPFFVFLDDLESITLELF